MEIALSVFRSKFFITALVIVLNISAQTIYKQISLSNNGIQNNLSFIFHTFFNIKVIAGMMFQVCSLALWFFVLRKYDLIWAALMSSLIPVGLIISGYYMFNESLSLHVLIGAFFVILGLFILNIK